MLRSSPRPVLDRRFALGHGLGNDYLIFQATGERDGWRATPEAVARVCDRRRGVGADGVVAVASSPPRGVRLRMFNPDGTEFERSGNGLRIVAAHLAGRGTVPVATWIEAEVGGSLVTLRAEAGEGGVWDVQVGLGRARLGAAAVGLQSRSTGDSGGGVSLPFAGPGDVELDVTPVSVGNPHLVVFGQPVTDRRLAELGPGLTGHPLLAAGANVQLAEMATGGVRALAWERGAGPTSASGTSACAVAAACVARRLLPPGEVRVEMPGGTLLVAVDAELDIGLRGPAQMIATGELDASFAARLARDVSQ